MCVTLRMRAEVRVCVALRMRAEVRMSVCVCGTAYES